MTEFHLFVATLVVVGIPALIHIIVRHKRKVFVDRIIYRS
jgi:hypothetical protein